MSWLVHPMTCLTITRQQKSDGRTLNQKNLFGSQIDHWRHVFRTTMLTDGLDGDLFGLYLWYYILKILITLIHYLFLKMRACRVVHSELTFGPEKDWHGFHSLCKLQNRLAYCVMIKASNDVTGFIYNAKVWWLT